MCASCRWVAMRRESLAISMWARLMAAVASGPLLALVTLAAVPLTTNAGEWLEKHVGSDPLVRRHTELGDGLLPWVIGLFVVAVGVWWVARGAATSGPTAPAGGRRFALPVRIAAAVLALGVSVGAVVDVYRVGDSGAKAAWHDGFSKTASSGDGDD